MPFTPVAEARPAGGGTSGLPPFAERFPPFAERFEAVRATVGPLVLGLDPSAGQLVEWGLPDTADGLESFVDIALDLCERRAAGIVKPQSAFYERHGWQGIRALSRLVAGARSAGVLVVLDVKRGDVGSTNDAYAAAYLGSDAPIAADALTLSAYLGVDALGAFFELAAASASGVFVVVRSSNPEGRPLQEAHRADGLTVEASLLQSLAARNKAAGAAPGRAGPFGAVFTANHGAPRDIDLAGVGGLFLVPGIGAQGASLGDVTECFAGCYERVLPSASRSLLAAGPDPGRLHDAVAAFGAEVRDALATS